MSFNSLPSSLNNREGIVLFGLFLFFLAVVVYGVLVLVGLVVPVGIGILRLAVIVFVIYLFYRLVRAVELIAEKM